MIKLNIGKKIKKVLIGVIFLGFGKGGIWWK